MTKTILALVVALSSTFAYAGQHCPNLSGSYVSDHPQFSGIVFEVEQDDCQAVNLTKFDQNGKQVDEPDFHLMDGEMKDASDGTFYSNKWIDNKAVFTVISKDRTGSIYTREGKEISFYKLMMVLEAKNKNLVMHIVSYSGIAKTNYEDSIVFTRKP